jgi:hypothetical protein
MTPCRTPARPTRTPTARHAAVEPLEDRRLMSVALALSANTLFAFDTATPGQTLAKVKVKGLARKEALIGIDFRPATGQLYGVGDANRVYRIDPTTGAATAVDATGAAFNPVLAGTSFGVDFNPVPDRIRVVSDADANVRLNPDTGAVVDFDAVTAGVQTDLALAYAAGDPNFGANPNVTALAYTRNAGGITTAYGIDVDTNTLVTVGSVGGAPNSPNGGMLSTVGSLNVDPVSTTGFDVDTNGAADVAFAALATADTGRSSLYTINLATGAATAVGEIAASKRPVTDIAVVPKGNTVLAVDAKNRLYAFDTNLPNVVTSRLSINGLVSKEKVVGIDVRPATGQVYAFTNQGRLYTLDTTTGLATTVGMPTAVALAKKGSVGFDFNPAVDRIRVVDTVGENLRLNPADGQIVDTDAVLAGVQFDTPLAFASTDRNATRVPSVSGVAYTNSFAGTTTTTLFALDSRQDVLVTIGSPDGTTSPNTGQLFTVGTLGLKASDPAGFDILTDATDPAAVTNTGYAVFKAGGRKLSLYTIDLTTGAATPIGALGKGVSPVGIAVLPG